MRGTSCREDSTRPQALESAAKSPYHLLKQRGGRASLRLEPYFLQET